MAFICPNTRYIMLCYTESASVSTTSSSSSDWQSSIEQSRDRNFALFVTYLLYEHLQEPEIMLLVFPRHWFWFWFFPDVVSGYCRY